MDEPESADCVDVAASVWLAVWEGGRIDAMRPVSGRVAEVAGDGARGRQRGLLERDGRGAPTWGVMIDLLSCRNRLRSSSGSPLDVSRADANRVPAAGRSASAYSSIRLAVSGVSGTCACARSLLT
jgi:hypothetical protein